MSLTFRGVKYEHLSIKTVTSSLWKLYLPLDVSVVTYGPYFSHFTRI